MRYVLENIEVRKISDEVTRRGIPSSQRVRVVVETSEEDLPLAEAAMSGGAFDFLLDEPDLYSEADIKR